MPNIKCVILLSSLVQVRVKQFALFMLFYFRYYFNQFINNGGHSTCTKWTVVDFCPTTVLFGALSKWFFHVHQRATINIFAKPTIIIPISYHDER